MEDTCAPLPELAGLVRAYFRRRVADPDDAEDLAQEALCALLSAAPRFRGDSSPSTWAWAVCRNVMARHLATRRRRERVLAALAAEPLEGRRGEDEERARDLAILFTSLRPEERLLYECHYARGLSVRETALALGRPEGTIKYQLHLLRERLRKLL